jgi:hypothetical protein
MELTSESCYEALIKKKSHNFHEFNLQYTINIKIKAKNIYINLARYYSNPTSLYIYIYQIPLAKTRFDGKSYLLID